MTKPEEWGEPHRLLADLKFPCVVRRVCWVFGGYRPLPGFDGSAAYAVNGAEQIAGTLLRGGRETHAFVYASGIMQELNTLVSEPEWVLETARDINRNVEIGGNGTYRGSGAWDILG